MTARETEEQAIRQACGEAGYVGLGVIALADGLSLATTRKLVAYTAFMVLGAARTAAAVLVAERMAPGVVTDPRKES